MVVGLACMPVGAADLTINTSGAAPFVYDGHTYLPLQSVASFLGATTRWDSQKGQSVMTYNGLDFALSPNKTNAWFNNKPVKLSSRPVVIDGRTYVPLDSLKKYYKVPVEWYGDRSEVRIKGADGWGTAKVKNRAPWHGGPPPWAPAWGQRNKSAATTYHVTSGSHNQGNGTWQQKGKSQGQKSKAAVKQGKHLQGQGQSKQKGNGKAK